MRSAGARSRAVRRAGRGSGGGPPGRHSLEAGYRRFVERRLREEFGFEGTPIHLSVRVREKRGRKK
ncbi:hypothetical protein LE181_23340 [Streptomyces sp. SCA3-4]|nr:hypothetical protein [Streptomyces sichuanensis]MCA6095094.1 hypothetical protein [Streptomyces sichuanensis]